MLVGHARAVARAQGDAPADRPGAERDPLQPRRRQHGRAESTACVGLLPAVVEKLRSLTRLPAGAGASKIADVGLHAHRRRHVRRRGFVGRGRAAARAGHDVVGLSMQLYDQREGATTRLRPLLLARRPARRAARGGGDRHPALRPEPRASVPGDRHRQLRVRVRRGPHADSLRALQQRPEVRDAGRSRGRLRAPTRGAPATTPGVEADAATGRRRLLRGRDRAKDQSYFLFALTQAQLAHAAFPGRRD